MTIQGTYSGARASTWATSRASFRYVPEIDALRGLAALTVVFEHAFVQGRAVSPWLHLFTNGQAAVVLFFVMSGFALGAQLGERKLTLRSYFGFCVRRCFRLLPLVWLSLGLAYLVLWIFWSRETSPEIIFWNALLRSYEMNPPLWSIAVELFCSLVFPILFVIFRRCDLTANLIVLSGLFVLWAVLPDPYQTHLRFEWLRYLVCFQIGLVAARYGRPVVQWLSWAKVPVFIVCIALAGVSLPEWSNALLALRSVAFAFVVAIVIHASGEAATLLLRLVALRFLGLISFSLYALHMPIINAVYHPYYDNLPATLVGKALTTNWVFLAIVLIVAVPAAAFAYRYLEVPLNNLGRAIEKRILR